MAPNFMLENDRDGTHYAVEKDDETYLENEQYPQQEDGVDEMNDCYDNDKVIPDSRRQKKSSDSSSIDEANSRRFDNSSPTNAPSKHKKSNKTSSSSMFSKHPTDPSAPKRPFSAYNLFFKVERQRMLENDFSNNNEDEQEIHGDDEKVLYTVEDCDQAVQVSLEQHRQSMAEPLKYRRKHRKSHGKISFTDLARMIAKKWKKLSSANRNVFEHYVTHNEKQRYEREMIEWANSKRHTTNQGTVDDERSDSSPKNVITSHHQAIEHEIASVLLSARIPQHQRDNVAAVSSSSISSCSDDRSVQRNVDETLRRKNNQQKATSVPREASKRETRRAFQQDSVRGHHNVAMNEEEEELLFRHREQQLDRRAQQMLLQAHLARQQQQQQQEQQARLMAEAAAVSLLPEQQRHGQYFPRDSTTAELLLLNTLAGGVGGGLNNLLPPRNTTASNSLPAALRQRMRMQQQQQQQSSKRFMNPLDLLASSSSADMNQSRNDLLLEAYLHDLYMNQASTIAAESSRQQQHQRRNHPMSAFKHGYDDIRAAALATTSVPSAKTSISTSANRTPSFVSPKSSATSSPVATSLSASGQKKRRYQDVNEESTMGTVIASKTHMTYIPLPGMEDEKEAPMTPLHKRSRRYSTSTASDDGTVESPNVVSNKSSPATSRTETPSPKPSVPSNMEAMLASMPADQRILVETAMQKGGMVLFFPPPASSSSSSSSIAESETETPTAVGV